MVADALHVDVVHTEFGRFMSLRRWLIKLPNYSWLSRGVSITVDR